MIFNVIEEHHRTSSTSDPSEIITRNAPRILLIIHVLYRKGLHTGCFEPIMTIFCTDSLVVKRDSNFTGIASTFGSQIKNGDERR